MILTVVGLAVVGTFIAAVLGTIWYSNATPMGKLHMRYLGFDKLSPDEQKQKMKEGMAMMKKLYAGQMALSFLTSLAVVFIVVMSMSNGVSRSLALGFVLINWLAFTVPVIGTSILWSNCDRAIAWKKFFSDSGYQLVFMLLLAFVASLFA